MLSPEQQERLSSFYRRYDEHIEEQWQIHYGKPPAPAWLVDAMERAAYLEGLIKQAQRAREERNAVSS